MRSPSEDSRRGGRNIPRGGEEEHFTGAIKRDFSTAETDLSVDDRTPLPDTLRWDDAARSEGAAGDHFGSSRGAGNDDVRLTIPPSAPTSSVLSNQSGESPEVDYRQSDQYLAGAVKVVKWSGIGGSLLLTMKALETLFNYNYSLTIAFAICSGLVLYSGFEGAVQQEVTRLYTFVSLAIGIAIWNILEGMWTTMWLAIVISKLTPETIYRTYGTTKHNVIWYYCLQLALAMASLVFWGLSAYSGYRLSQAIKARRIETARHTHRRLARESILSQTAASGTSIHHSNRAWPTTSLNAVADEDHSDATSKGGNEDPISSERGQAHSVIEVELGCTIPRPFRRAGADDIRTSRMIEEVNEIGNIVMGTRLSELEEVTVIGSKARR